MSGHQNTTNAILAPEQLSQLLHHVANDIVGFDDLVLALLPVIDGHVELDAPSALAMSVALHHIEEQNLLQDQVRRLVYSQSAPSLAVTEGGALLMMNQPASQLFAIPVGEPLEALGVGREEFLQLKKRLYDLPGPTLMKLDTGSVDQPSLVMVASYHHNLRVFMLTALQQRWPPSIDRALEDLFGLSQSERDVLAALSQGQTAEQISRQRSRAVGTVRQQIKTILQKLGASNQVQAATLGAAVANVIGSPQVASDALPRLESSELIVGEVSRQGRRVGWRRFGKTGGQPVLLLHGSFFGAGDLPSERALARDLGLDIIAVERLGYGRTEPPLSHQNVLETQVEDILAVLDALGCSKVKLLSQDIAVVVALQLCQRIPERIISLTAVSAPAPYREMEQITGMPGKQRMFIWATRHATWLVRLLIRLGMVQMRKLGPLRWMEGVFGDLPNEMAVVNRPEIADGLTGVYGFNLNQGGLGYEMDLVLCNLDWGDDVTNLRHPCTFFHGTENETTLPKYAALFQTMNPNVHIVWQEGAGQTLILSHFDAVLRHVRG